MRKNKDMLPKFIKKTEGNKKIKNASKVIYDGIEFKSKLEGNCYLLLKASKLTFCHECMQCVLFTGFKDTGILEWSWGKDGNLKRKSMTKVADMTYTPDFVITGKEKVVFVESKGIFNDLFTTKRKMFYQYLSKLRITNGIHYEYALVKNLKQMRELIGILESEEGFVE